ncbi:hypothetical protein PTKIN_Ptkin16aG0495300 [Pterospermum kingtungense]
MPPFSGSVGFNVDGSSTGMPGPADKGGVMRDHTGKELACFSKSIAVEYLNIAESLAIRERSCAGVKVYPMVLAN